MCWAFVRFSVCLFPFNCVLFVTLLPLSSFVIAQKEWILLQKETFLACFDNFLPLWKNVATGIPFVSDMISSWPGLLLLWEKKTATFQAYRGSLFDTFGGWSLENTLVNVCYPLCISVKCYSCSRERSSDWFLSVKKTKSTSATLFNVVHFLHPTQCFSLVKWRASLSGMHHVLWHWCKEMISAK